MLRPSDLMLTLGALCLLLAALDMKPRVIRASAAAHTQEAPGQPTRRADDLGVVMDKIKRNLESREPQLRRQVGAQAASNVDKSPPAAASLLSSAAFMEQKYGDKRHNSYNYYANEMASAAPNERAQAQLAASSADLPSSSSANRQQHQQHQQAQEVQVEFLRSARAEPHTQAGGAEPAGPPKQQNANSLYLLSHFGGSNSLAKSAPPPASRFGASANEPNESNELKAAEQQQQPPFTLYPPPFNRAQGPAELQAGQLQLPGQLNGLSPATQQNIRNILSNYQRTNPQLAALGQQFAQQQLGQRGSADQQALLRNFLQQVGQAQPQLQPQPPTLGRPTDSATPPARPAPARPAVATPQPAHPAQPGQQSAPAQPGQQQQGFSPLQLITAPFQAFLPGLAGSGPQQQPSAASAAGGPAQQGGSPAQTLGGLFNPFGGGGGGGTGGQQAQGMPNLQALYQQLPIYQALLAARQRQEALQAAEKLRLQQQQGGGGGGARRPAYGGSQTAPGQPAGPSGANLQPFGNQFGVNNNNQPPPPQQQQGYANPLPVQPQQPHRQQQQQQPQQPAQEPSPVKFDDDTDNNGANNAGGQAANNNDGGPNNNALAGNDNAGQDQNDNQANNEQSDNGGGGGGGNGADSGGNEPANEANDGGSGGGGSGNGKAEEEDPDLKQFQNLANGGDSFTDLFPPGILSNHDISDIKKQQEEQARKQDEEQRQRQRGHNQNQEQEQPQQPQNGQQPINQFANDQQQQQQQPAQEQGGAGADQSPGSGGGGGTGGQDENNGAGNADNDNNNSNGAPEENGNEGGGGGNGEADGPDANEADDGGQDDGAGDSDQAGEGGNEEQEENPTAAALTAKSNDNNSGGNGADKAEPKRFSESPGVEYAAK